MDDVASFPVDVPLGEPGQCFFEGDATFEAGQRCAEADMRTEAEGEVTFDLALDVETVRIAELAGVTSRCRLDEDDDPAFGNDLPVQEDISLRDAGQAQCGGLVAQDLLDAVADQVLAA